MLMIEPSATAAVRFSAANVDSSTRLYTNSATLSLSRRLIGNSGGRRVKCGNCIRASAKEHSSSGSGFEKQKYHPFEEIAESELFKNEEATLSPAETTRTIIEVNSKAMMMFSGFVSDEIHENVFWSDIPYVTDEHGNIYFQVKNDEDILQTISSEENIVQVIIGLDTAEMISEVELLGHSEIDFGIDELDDEDSDFRDEEDDDTENDNYGKGAVLVKNLAAKEPSALSLDTYYKQYYLSLAAAAATIKWIEAEKGVIITNHSLSVTFNGSFDHVNIDATSVHNLEVIDPMHSSLFGTNNKKRSLFHMLKTTRTAGGTRLLRANLLQPLKDIETINARLDCLDELMSNEQLFFGLSQALRKFPKEIDRVLCHFCFKPKKVTNEVLALDNSRKSQILISSIILLKTALEALPLVSKVLKDANSYLLKNVYKSICENEKYAFMRKRIGEVIDEDVLHARVPFVARTQQCFAVKAGMDGILDIARRSFCDTSEAIYNLASKYRADFNLPNLKIPFNNRQGFYFSIPLKDIQGKLPSKFIQVIKQGNNIHCSSLELASLNVRNKSAAKECYTRTELCLEALMDDIREDVSVLTLLAEVLCLLDMIVNSFAHTISTKPVDKYTRPQFTCDGPLAMDSGRHPILESTHSDFVANNIFLSEASNMVIVSGPNMSGKSTYLQQVCLIVILAQIGCYVPARFATLRVVDRIFTRMGTTDSLESNSSTFMTEMKETAFILQNVSHRSLIVMDELGRATSSSDGFAVAWSCCEHLLALKAYTIFATHMENLSELATIYPNLKILHFHVDIKKGRMDFKFQLKDGPRHVPHYGLMLAGVAGLPSSVIETAERITSRITQKEMKRMEINCEQYRDIQMAYRVAQRLMCLKYSNQDEDSIRQALQHLKENYLNGGL